MVLLTACDARIAAGPVADAPAVGAGRDASMIPSPDAASFGPWSPPAKITVAAVAGRDDDDETLSSNGLEMIYAVTNTKGTKDLFYTQRPSATSTDWTTPAKLSFTVDGDQTPRLSADDLTLYFGRTNPTDSTLDIWQARRDAAGTNTWQTPTKLTAVDSAVTEKWYMPCPVKGSTDYIMAKDTAGDKTTHLVESMNGGTPAPITPLVSDGTSETGTFLSPDCLTIYFASTRDPMRTMIYTSRRTAIGAPWAAPQPVVDFPITGVTGDNQEDPWMASDLRTFVFASNAGGDKDVYISTR